ncbi:S1/P1 nuclease [Sphingomonas colocasiae]|uniref:S1/P1 nuclease n=1 Tax=Sphingomonas colocasiae TaxID=1848973 RepID=A0ABS7PMR2_9SPHN|nr:S1/P1 nuclease [Sphingomonas colocasiae]MBY8822528.1 S1/P1 nuclease [Sphingomonas colocasiae]
MTRLLAFLATLFLLVPAPAQAWWEYGHETVGAIAYRNVTPKARTAIDALLSKGRLLETPTCPVNTIELASYWPDCAKELGLRFSYAYSWHYQNVDICKPFDLKAACRDGNCVSAQVDRNLKLLKDKSVPERERLMALVFLVHFVGDLHQPLHAGDKSDLGGNRARAAYGDFVTQRLNLHAIWDGYLAERAISTPPPLVRIYSAEERAAMNGGTTEDWSRESWQVARDTVYASAYGGDPCTGPAQERSKLSNETIETLIQPLRLQVERGGLRLARLLDEALG